YVHGPGVDQPLVWYEGAVTTNKTWLYSDHQGSIVATANSAGTSTATLSYGPYGEPNATTGVRFRYTGQQLLGPLNLYYYKARFYSPAIGRFLQTDPIGYQDGLNWYAYVGNNPFNRNDPSGLDGKAAYGFASEALGSTDYNKSSVNLSMGPVNFGVGSYKCNIFVNDALTMGGDAPSLNSGRPYLAGEWATQSIPGYVQMPKGATPQIGDVVAVAMPGNNGYTGHVGIYSPNSDGSPGTISASSRVNSVAQSGWPWGGDHPVPQDQITIQRSYSDYAPLAQSAFNQTGASTLNGAVMRSIGLK
ncbi:MAG: RHS repeat-associated core domain-containing protein, partial [Methylococcaceae bacterium]|nr:RHS repeat-associated core domain-containing protein [Methylococcaceae bacterium]MDP3932161.1 RHS repeat-associated core domain-containing protein [Methylococcaceae bacterium]MDZ4158130.1 RHS repeat-associated core domain-containing protein [Methylococcales bacterium]